MTTTVLKEKLQEKALSAAQQKEKGFQQIITSELAKQFQAMKSLVPKHVTPERLARVGLQALSRTPKLMECSPESIIGAIMNCATMGLEPNLIGHAYLVPFWNNKARKMEAQFQIGYKGYIDLVRRTGEVSRIYAYEVYEHDEFSYELGVNATLIHRPKINGDRGEVLAYYSVYHLKDGGYGFYVISKQEAMQHALTYSKSQKDGKLFGPWVDNFDEMAKKTAIRKMIKYMPISIENQDVQNIMEGISRDEQVVTIKKDTIGITDQAFFDSQYMMVDSETSEIINEEPPREESIKEKHERLTRVLSQEEDNSGDD